jgi:hypothetical protein
MVEYTPTKENGCLECGRDAHVEIRKDHKISLR